MIDLLEINNLCISCDSCRQICPEKSILTDGTNYAIDNWSCSRCELCVQVCPADSIRYVVPIKQA